VAVERGHLEDHRGHHRVQAAVEREQVAPVAAKRVEFGAVGEVEPARQAGQHLAQAQDVGQRVVVFEAQLPGGVAGQVDGARGQRVGRGVGHQREVLRPRCRRRHRR
jgi:hypothetical protein